MRVICIKGVRAGESTVLGEFIRKDDEVYEGEIYTASQSPFWEDSYRLAEKPSGLSYKKSRFIPLSDIDEAETHKETLTQKQLES